MAAPYTPPVEDMLFTLEHVAGWREGNKVLSDKLPQEDIRSILEESGSLAAGMIAPLNQASDRAPSAWREGAVSMPPGWKEAYGAWAAAGWNGIALPEEFGGAGMPVVLGTATMEMLTSACMAMGTLPVLTQGAVEALHAHASEELKQRYLPRLVSGEWTATMDLTEPQAGSDLGALRTAAMPAADGSYLLRGQKIFITYGEHDLTENIIHLVLARLPDAPAGPKGISLFLVPKFLLKADGSPGARNDMHCAGIEHKLGIRSSPTCSMVYGEMQGAVGWLVGRPNEGLACMFTMMNKARLATGLQGVAIAERALQQALAYAHERRQGRLPGSDESTPIIRHPDVMRNALTMAAYTAAARAIAYRAAAEIDRSAQAEDAAARNQAALYAGLLTPMVKAFATDAGVKVASLGIQIHGGMGYVEETGAAQHWRDARIAPIYEGTNGIQAIDLVSRKLMRDGGTGLAALLAEMQLVAQSAQAANEHRFGAMGERLAEGIAACERVRTWLVQPGRDLRLALAAATPSLRLFATVLGGALLAKGALAARQLDPAGAHPAHARRIGIARFYAESIVAGAQGLEQAALGSAQTVIEAGTLFD
jgi:butyryl-CoA dehydrogenase